MVRMTFIPCSVTRDTLRYSIALRWRNYVVKGHTYVLFSPNNSGHRNDLILVLCYSFFVVKLSLTNLFSKGEEENLKIV